MNLFYDHAVPLAVEVAGRALAGLADGVDEIGLLVFVTSTGFIAPGVDVALVKQLGLPPSVSRVVVNFMGCAAAMNGLRTATDYVRSHPDRKALVVCIELCSVNAVFADDINDVIISSLFGDGCAAVVVGASQVLYPLTPGKVVIRDTFSRLLDGAEDGIVLGVNHNGVTCELSENLPSYIYDGVAPVVAEVLAEQRITEVRHRSCGQSIPGDRRSSSSRLGRWAYPRRLRRRAGTCWPTTATCSACLCCSCWNRWWPSPIRHEQLSTGVAFSFAPGVAVEGMLFDIVRQ